MSEVPLYDSSKLQHCTRFCWPFPAAVTYGLPCSCIPVMVVVLVLGVKLSGPRCGGISLFLAHLVAPCAMLRSFSLWAAAVSCTSVVTSLELIHLLHRLMAHVHAALIPHCSVHVVSLNCKIHLGCSSRTKDSSFDMFISSCIVMNTFYIHCVYVYGISLDGLPSSPCIGPGQVPTPGGDPSPATTGDAAQTRSQAGVTGKCCPVQCSVVTLCKRLA